jgi:hypothetical protein
MDQGCQEHPTKTGLALTIIVHTLSPKIQQPIRQAWLLQINLENLVHKQVTPWQEQRPEPVRLDKATLC